MGVCGRITRVVLLGAFIAFALGAPPAFAEAVLADSYSESNIDDGMTLYSNRYSYQLNAGQSFTAIRGTLDSVTFYVSRSGDAVGTARAFLYASEGNFGTNSNPVGPLLAESTPVDVTTFSTVGSAPVTLRFDNTVELTAGGEYCIILSWVDPPPWTWENPGGTGRVTVYRDVSAPTHPGNFCTFVGSNSSVDVPFYVYQTPPVLAPVYRFYNRTNGTHFYTDSEAEKNHALATWPTIYTLDGPAYYLNPNNNSTPLIRLYNRVVGSHFYTADVGEASYALATWPNVFELDGPTYKVNPASVAYSVPVYRFYNLKNGSHFYTASADERDMVRLTWPTIYSYEGPAFWIGQ